MSDKNNSSAPSATFSYTLEAASGYEATGTYENISPEQYGKIVAVLNGTDSATASPAPASAQEGKGGMTEAWARRAQAAVDAMVGEKDERTLRHLHGRMEQLLREALETRQSTLGSAPHPDDIAVDRFAAAMKDKMAKSRAKGRGGWDDPAQCGTQDLADMLVDHIEKGDPVDIGNFAMMLWNRGAWAGDLVSALSQYVLQQTRRVPQEPVVERAEVPTVLETVEFFMLKVLDWEGSADRFAATAKLKDWFRVRLQQHASGTPFRAASDDGATSGEACAHCGRYPGDKDYCDWIECAALSPSPAPVAQEGKAVEGGQGRKCKRCDGTGLIHNSSPVRGTCPLCAGTGTAAPAAQQDSAQVDAPEGGA